MQLRRPAAPRTAVCKLIKYAVSPFNPNTYLNSEDAVHVVIDTAGGTLGGLLGGKLSEALKLAATGTLVEALDAVFRVLAGLHGSVLALGLELKSGPPLNQDSAYGRSRLPGEGSSMHFRVEAVYHEVLSPQDAECLSEMGFEMPEKQSVGGMDVAWMDEDVSGKPLDQHGTSSSIYPATSPTGARTRAASARSTSRRRTVGARDGRGVVTDRGGLVPRALWGFKFKNPFGSITQILFPLLGPELRWNISYHRPRGFRFATPLTFPPTPSGGLNDGFAISAHVCGEDLYASPWAGTEYLLDRAQEVTRRSIGRTTTGS